jgi:uncharacterized protein (TIGR02271 family)
MFFGMRVEPGASVEATDGRFGTVEEVMLQPDTGNLSYLVVRYRDDLVRIPAGLINEVPNPREVHLGLTTEEAYGRVVGHVEGANDALDDASQLRIPIYEERLQAAVEEVGLGEVRVHKLVDEVEETVEQVVTRDDLDIERIPMHIPLTVPSVARQEGDWYVVPVMEEVLVVQKRLMLVEEVRIRTRRVTETAQVRETVRRERVTIEDDTVHGVVGADVGPQGRRRRQPRDVSARAQPIDPPVTD